MSAQITQARIDRFDHLKTSLVDSTTRLKITVRAAIFMAERVKETLGKIRKEFKRIDTSTDVGMDAVLLPKLSKELFPLLKRLQHHIERLEQDQKWTTLRVVV